MGELSVTAVDVVPVDGVDHSYVRLSGPSGSTTVIVEPGGSIDMLAMTGPGLVRPLRSLLVALPDGAVDGPTVATSLRTGLLNPRLDIPPQFYGETQDLIALIDR